MLILDSDQGYKFRYICLLRAKILRTHFYIYGTKLSACMCVKRNGMDKRRLINRNTSKMRIRSIKEGAARDNTSNQQSTKTCDTMQPTIYDIDNTTCEELMLARR